MQSLDRITRKVGKKLIAGLCGAALLGGCSEADRYIMEHPNMSWRTAHNIRIHQVTIGMSKDEARASIGSPDSIRSWKPNPYELGDYLISVDDSLDDPSRRAWIYQQERYKDSIAPLFLRDRWIVGIEGKQEKTGQHRKLTLLFKEEEIYKIFDTGVRSNSQ